MALQDVCDICLDALEERTYVIPTKYSGGLRLQYCARCMFHMTLLVGTYENPKRLRKWVERDAYDILFTRNYSLRERKRMKADPLYQTDDDAPLRFFTIKIPGAALATVLEGDEV